MSEAGRSVTLRLPTMRGVTPLIGLLAAVAVIAGSVVAGVRTSHLESKNDRLAHSLSPFAAGALTAARGYAVRFATYSYDQLDSDFAATEAHAVDPFLSQYRSYTTKLSAGMVQLKSKSSAKLISAGLVSLSSTSAVADLFLDQTIQNTKASSVEPQRIRMTMVRRDNRWLISKVELFTT
ncbi:MAG TPA: hypothetical protein VHV76_10905 [Mycobacteriales bacterium]|jgi:hypothetical protein|nr:hypothetical protein [Mycobacteriales bacterium]